MWPGLLYVTSLEPQTGLYSGVKGHDFSHLCISGGKVVLPTGLLVVVCQVVVVLGVVPGLNPQAGHGFSHKTLTSVEDYNNNIFHDVYYHCLCVHSKLCT